MYVYIYVYIHILDLSIFYICLRRIAWHRIALPYVPLHDIELHSSTLYYSTLHCILYMIQYNIIYGGCSKSLYLQTASLRE